MTIQEFKKQNPNYAKVNDYVLADEFYNKYYADNLTKEQFYKQIGLPLREQDQAWANNDFESLRVKQTYPQGGVPLRPGEKAPEFKEPSLMDMLVGGVESDISMFTGMTTGFLGYMSGLMYGTGKAIGQGTFGTPEGNKQIQETAEQTAARYTYTPKTETGQEITERVGGMLSNAMAFGPHPEMMTGDVGGAMAGASPIVKAKGAEYLTKAQNVTKPVVETIKKPFEKKPLSVEKITGLEYKASRGDKKAEQKIIKLSETDPDAIEAANRLGLDLPADLLMQESETNKIAGAARSITASLEEMRFKNDIIHTAEVADEVLSKLSKYNNIAEANKDVQLALTTSHDMMKNQEKILYKAFDDSLPKETPVVADNLFEVLSNTAKELGGEDKLSPTEKRLFALSKDQSLTYGALLREKQNIGSSTKNAMFPDVNDYQLGKIYDAIKQDQKDAVALNLGDDALKNLDIANSLTVKRKGIENQIIAGFGKKGEGSVASLIKQAIASGSKGDVAPLNKLLSIVPKEMHKDVIATALKELSSSGRAADAGTFDFANYAKMYDGLRRNSPIYKTVIETIGTDKAQMLQDLYTISKKIVEAKQNVLHTGKANQAIIAGLKGNSLMQAVVGKIIGWTTSKVTAGLVSPEFLFKTPQEKLQSIANLLRDPDFKQLIIDASKGKATTEAVNKVMETEAFKQVAKDMPKEEIKETSSEAQKAKPTKEEVKAKVEAKKAEKAEAANKTLSKEEHSQVLESISDASLQNMMDLYGQDKTRNSFMNSDWEKLKKLGYLEDKLDIEGNTYQVLSAKGEEALYKERDRRNNQARKNTENKPIEQQIAEKEQSIKALKQRIKKYEANAKDEFATDESIEQYNKALGRDRNALAKSEKELAELKKKVVTPENEATTLYKEVKDNKNLDAYKSLMVDEGGAKTKGERNKSHNWFDVPVEDDFGQTVATKRIAGQRDITEAFTADKASIDRFMKGKATVEDLKAIKHDLNTFELNSDLRDEASILKANKSNESVELSDGSIYDPFSKMTYSKKEWQDLMDEAMFSKSPAEQSRLKEWHKDSAPETKNEDGSPKVFYHGTKANFDTFDIEKSNVGNYGTGFYFGENAEAISKHFADKPSSNIMPAYLKADNLFDATKINKPLVEDYLKSINAEGFTPNYEIRPFLFYKSIMSLKGTESFKKFIQSKGYDGIIGQTPAVGKQIVVFSPEQIKSVFNKGTFSESNPNILMSKGKAFNSVLKDAIDSMPNKMNTEAFKSYLKGKGVKDDEINFSGIKDILDKQTVTKQEVLEALNQPTLEKKVLGVDENEVALWWNDEGGANEEIPFNELSRQEKINATEQYMNEVESYQDNTKFSQYKTPNVGTNYREVLTTTKESFKDWFERNRASDDPTWSELQTLPNKQEYIDAYNAEQGKTQFKSSHWDEPNVLYHTRLQDTTIGKEKTLLVEEIQSDWHQKGRSEGYKQNYKTIPPEYEIIASTDMPGYEVKNGDKILQTNWFRSRADAEKAVLNALNSQGVPQAPYSKTWHEKAMKDIIDEAVNNGYDRVAWTVGKTQADRYSLAKQVDKLDARKRTHGWDVRIWDKNNRDHIMTGMTDKELADNVGKEMANKIIQDGGGKYEGLDLEVGGEGMKGFYDKILPDFTNKYIKKYGSKVEKKTLSNGDEVWSFEVTDKMKEDISGKGQSLFSQFKTKNATTKQEAQTIAQNLLGKHYAKHADTFEIVQSVEDLPQNIKDALYSVEAYHGTPHNVDRFSTKYIGTGEGAQAYGYGMYFADSKEVARHYQKTLPSYNGKAMRDFEDWQQSVLYRISQDGYDNAKAFYEKQAEVQKEHFGEVLKLTKRDLDFTNQINPKDIKGNLYKVELKPKENEYLQWDKPLSEQSPQVRKVLKQALGKARYSDTDTGGYVYKHILQGGFADDKGILKSEQGASDYLHSLGIKGIKYLDNTSRGKGEGNYNYVIFKDEDVGKPEILKSGGKARGIFDPKSGKAYIIADAMKANEVEGVILHELLHKNINNEVKAGKSRAEAIMGSRYESVVKRLDNLYKMGDKQVKDAFQKVTDANTPAQHRIEEVMTYLLENITNESKPLLIKWKDEVIAAIKAFIAKTALQLGMKAETVMSKLDSKDIANILRSEAIKNESMLKNIKR